LASSHKISLVVGPKGKDFPTHVIYVNDILFYVELLGNLRSILWSSYMFVILSQTNE